MPASELGCRQCYLRRPLLAGILSPPSCGPSDFQGSRDLAGKDAELSGTPAGLVLAGRVWCPQLPGQPSVSMLRALRPYHLVQLSDLAFLL